MYTVKRVGSQHLRIVSGKNDEGSIMHVLVSYDTPIAYTTDDDNDCYVTDVNWSRTTNRHRSRACETLNRRYENRYITFQEACDWALEFLVGDKRLPETRETSMGRKADTRIADYTENRKPGDANLFVPIYRRF